MYEFIIFFTWKNAISLLCGYTPSHFWLARSHFRAVALSASGLFAGMREHVLARDGAVLYVNMVRSLHAKKKRRAEEKNDRSLPPKMIVCTHDLFIARANCIRA